jgi:hypothetical protein
MIFCKNEGSNIDLRDFLTYCKIEEKEVAFKMLIKKNVKAPPT